MAVTKYEFSKLCDSGRLEQEILDSSIVIAIDHIVTVSSPAKTDVYFKAELSTEEEDALDAIVDGHTNTPLPDSPRSVSIDGPKNTDGRTVFHSTPRKRGTITTFVGEGDDVGDTDVGGGEPISLAHGNTDDTTQVKYIDLKTVANESYAHAGYIHWKDALLDLFSLHTVPRLSTYEAGSNTNFNLYGGFLIIPAAGNGTISVTDIVLVGVPINEFGDRQGAGYWNADFNTTTGEFENIAAAPFGDGAFNMFGAEIELDCFCRKLPLLGSGSMPLDTYDASQIGHNMRLKLTFETVGSNHAWWWAGMIKLYRKKTV